MTGRPRIPLETREAVLADVRADLLTSREIGERHGISYQTVDAYAKEARIRRRHGARIRYPLPVPGSIFGRWKVIGKQEARRGRERVVLCQCQCPARTEELIVIDRLYSDRIGGCILHARITQRFSCQRSKRTAIPFDYRRHEFGYENRRARWEEIERRAQGEAHAEPAYQQAGRLQRPRLLTGEGRQGLLGAVHAARHEAPAAGEDDVLVAAADQLEDGAASGKRLAEQLRRLHGGDVTGVENVSKNGPFRPGAANGAPGAARFRGYLPGVPSMRLVTRRLYSWYSLGLQMNS